jgi:hypothetical protein
MQEAQDGLVVEHNGEVYISLPSVIQIIGMSAIDGPGEFLRRSEDVVEVAYHTGAVQFAKAILEVLVLSGSEAALDFGMVEVPDDLSGLVE